MKPPYLRPALTSIALLAAATCGYVVGVHDAKDAATHDVITFAPSRNVDVKRIVGRPGDRIEVRNGAVLVNGDRLEEPAKTGR